MAFGDVIARLSVQLGLDTASFTTGSAKAKKELTGLERHVSRAAGAIKTAFVGLLGAFAFDQIASAAKQALDYAGSLGEIAEQLSVTTDTLQKYRYIASQAGVEQDTMDKGLARLSRTIGQAANGQKKQVELFDRLGISVRDSNGKIRDAGDILPEIANAYVKLGGGARGAALAYEVFGKSGQEMNTVLALGADGIAKMSREAEAMGLVLDEAMIANADEASDKLGKLEQLIKMKFTATVAENAKEIGHLADEIIGLIANIGSLRDQWRVLELQMKKVDIWTEPLGSSSWESRSKRAAEVNQEIAKIKGLPDQTSLAPTTTRTFNYIDAFGNPYTKTREQRLPKGGRGGGRVFGEGRVKFLGDSPFTAANDFAPGLGSADWIRSAEATGALATNLSRVAETLPKISINAGAMLARAFAGGAEEMERLAAATQSIVDRLYPQEARRRQYELDLATLQAGYRAAGKSAEELADAQAKLTREFNLGYPAVDAMVRGFARFKDAAAQASDAAARVDLTPLQQVQVNGLQSLQEGLVSAAIEFDNLGQTAKRVVQSILADLLRLAIQKAIIKPLAGALGLPIPGFASGTNWAPRGLALVGERGPELVQFRGGEKVIPNDQIAGRFGRAGDTFNISVSGAMSDRDARRTGHQIAASVSQRQAQARKAGIAG